MSGKMTRTFNAQSYIELLVRYQPKPIATEAENDSAIALAQELEHRPMRSPEEETFLELLITLIEKFEAEHYPIPTGTPNSMLRHLMDARELNESDLIPILGTPEKVRELLMGQKVIQPDEARKLAKFFRVDLNLLLPSDSDPRLLT
jgi:HTH-type transcriptional regulator / antitoxin HigA